MIQDENVANDMVKTLVRQETALNLFGDITHENAETLAEVLMKNRKIKKLYFCFFAVGHESVNKIAQAIKSNPSLTAVTIICLIGAAAFFKSLKTSTSITEFNFHCDEMSCAAEDALADVLKVNSVLRKLNLSSNHMELSAVKGMADALEENHTVTSLTLMRCKMDPRCAGMIAAALKKNSTLTSLNLGRNAIGDEGATALADAIKSNHALREVILNDCKISRRGATALADALKVNHSLKKLSLSNNAIHAEGMEAIFAALKDNHTLASLDLSNNGIWLLKNPESLVANFKNNTTLKALDLGRNHLRHDTETIAEAFIKNNYSLTELNLEYNCIDNTNGQAILEALKSNTDTALASLDIYSDEIGWEVDQAISDILIGIGNQITENERQEFFA